MKSIANLKFQYLICTMVQHWHDRFFVKRGSTFNKAPGLDIYFNKGPVTCSLNSIGANEDFESAEWSIIRTFIISYCGGRCYCLGGEPQLHRLWCGYITFCRGSTNLSLHGLTRHFKSNKASAEERIAVRKYFAYRWLFDVMYPIFSLNRIPDP